MALCAWLVLAKIDRPVWESVVPPGHGGELISILISPRRAFCYHGGWDIPFAPEWVECEVEP
jgi:hypothetical protein